MGWGVEKKLEEGLVVPAVAAEHLEGDGHIHSFPLCRDGIAPATEAVKNKAPRQPKLTLKGWIPLLFLLGRHKDQKDENRPTTRPRLLSVVAEQFQHRCLPQR